MEKKLASLLVVSLDKADNGITSALCSREEVESCSIVVAVAKSD